jgi:hypothetical protein
MATTPKVQPPFYSCIQVLSYNADGTLSHWYYGDRRATLAEAQADYAAALKTETAEHLTEQFQVVEFQMTLIPAPKA